MAPDAWAQAASMSKRVRKEQLLFMMLEDILGDTYELDVPRKTAWSIRLAQITDDYAVAVLARFQLDALPPHIPFHSSPSQSDQPPPKLCQSPHVRPLSNTEELCPASSAKYEHISLSKVGARPLRPSSTTDIRQNKPQPLEQQADEPRFTLQNVASKPSRKRKSESTPPPIYPVQPSVIMEATPSSVGAIEAPLSPIIASQQQSALLSFCPLHFKPFSSLLTSYRVPALFSIPVRIPDFQRDPLQPPQPPQLPPHEPSPADPVETACAAATTETTPAPVSSPAADPEGSEELEEPE